MTLTTSDCLYNEFADQLFLLDLVKNAYENSAITSVKYIKLSFNVITTIGEVKKSDKRSAFSKLLIKEVLLFSYLEEADGEKPIRTKRSSNSIKSIEKLILIIIHTLYNSELYSSFSKTGTKIKKGDNSTKKYFKLENIAEDIFKHLKCIGLETSKTFILDLIKRRHHTKNKTNHLGIIVLPYFQNLLTYPESMLIQNIDLFNKYNPDKTVLINISDCDPQSQKKLKDLFGLNETKKLNKF